MKVTVLVPSEEYKAYAGARIRYARIAPRLAERGIHLELADVASFAPQSADCDALVVSKCHDARSVLAAAIVGEKGRPVGADLFDDYFSQFGDARLARYRNWLAQLLPHCAFALCSTAAMARVVDSYRPGLPSHVMNDPAAGIDIDDLQQVLARKLVQVRDERRVRVAWFGVGDNPNFQVGLDDLAAFGGALAELARNGLAVDLRVLTNARALTANGLALIERVPVPKRVEEWTEEREAELLAEAAVAFLPVGAQSFSTAKSLNRAVTALGAGCQVLSAGYPLYRQLDELIYRDAAALAADLMSGAPRHSAERIDRFRGMMDSVASADAEAENLAAFLTGVEGPEPDSRGPLALVHGHSTNGAAHKLVQAAKGFSVASPYCNAPLGFDVVFRGAVGRLQMFVSEKAARRVPPELQKGLRPAEKMAGGKFLRVADGDAAPARGNLDSGSWSDAPLPFQLATYGNSVDQISARMNEVFGVRRVIVSETAALPFSRTI